MNKKLIFIMLVVLCGIIAGLLIHDYNRTLGDDVVREFVGRESCVVCHSQQAALFQDSHHDKAMDLATEQTVLGRFDGTEIEHYGVVTRVFKDGERFMVNTEGPDGQMQDFEIKYVFGFEPLQQYMVEIEKPVDAKVGEIGPVQVLSLCWNVVEQKWFHLTPPDVHERILPGDPLHWTGITQCWNASCAECHSTNLKKNFDPHSQNYRTTFSEIDVSCESCHGPGSLHQQIAENKLFFWDKQHGYGLTKLKTTSNIPQVESCAPCHSRRGPLKKNYVAGCNFDEYYSCQLLTEPIYHADGQIRDEDYVYGSFIQSKMFHQGIRCTDCHDPHSGRLKAEGNALCTSCHQHPAGKYDTPAHHHHQVGSEGASCVECHMPATTYMAIDKRRDHSLRVPRPDLSVEFGTPNACTACHIKDSSIKEGFAGANSKGKVTRPLTQYLDWIVARDYGDVAVSNELKRIDEMMLEATRKWYPSGPSATTSKYYEQLVIGNSGSPSALPTMIKLANDRTAPAIFRASAVQSLAMDGSKASLEAAREALQDADIKVVTAALNRIDAEIAAITNRVQYDSRPDFSAFKQVTADVGGLLGHESERVRIEAARVFVNLPDEARQRYASGEQRRSFESALRGLQESLQVNNERAMSHASLAQLYEGFGQLEKAKGAYGTAIVVEPNLAGPRTNLAALIEREIENLQREATAPNSPMTIGQRKNQVERMKRLATRVEVLRKEEHALLKIDVERSEGLAGADRVHYRYAMSCYVQRDLVGAQKHLLEAHEQSPENPDYLLGLSAYFREVGKPSEAVQYINQLLKMDPANQGYRALAAQIEKELKQ